MGCNYSVSLRWAGWETRCPSCRRRLFVTRRVMRPLTRRTDRIFRLTAVEVSHYPHFMQVRIVSEPRLRLFKLSGRQRVLAGSKNGLRMLGVLIGQGVPRPDVGPCFVDLAQIDVVTSSFFRDCVLGYRNHARTTVPHLYPVVANPSDTTLEEIAPYLDREGDAVWVCRLDARGSVSEPYVLGRLDPVQQQTLDLVQKLGQAEAPTLAANDRSIGITAWNNRLSALSSRRLLIEQRSGKTKIYRPVLEGRDGA